MPTIKEVVEKYIKDNGADGIVSADLECSCFKGNELIVCDEPMIDCQIIWNVKPTGKNEEFTFDAEPPVYKLGDNPKEQQIFDQDTNIVNPNDDSADAARYTAGEKECKKT